MPKKVKVQPEITPEPVAVMAAPDTDTGAGPQEEPERKKIANRFWVNDAGEEVEPEQATGIHYEFLGRGDQGADGSAFRIFFRDMSEAQKNMLAGFGGLTLAGNVTNTWLGEKGDKAARACDAISERFTLMHGGTWIDRAATAAPKVDPDMLLNAIVAAAGGNVPDAKVAALRSKIADDKTFVRVMRQRPDVANEYAKLAGKATKSLDELLADL